MAEHEHEHQQDDQHQHQHGGMGQRGVSRPQMHGGEGGEGHDHGGMSHEQREQMQRMHRLQTQWCWWLVIILGVWLISSPFTFGYADNLTRPADPAASPIPMPVRVWGMIISDVVSGLALMVFGYWALRNPLQPKVEWAACAVGIWLNFAPLVFWSPSAAAYVNNTLIGALVIGLTILIPGMPWMIMMMKHGPTVPPGWSYNPSSWPQRWIMIATGVAGWFVSRYLAAYQLDYISSVWDPFFGDGSRRVLESDLSAMWPVSDGGLGAFTYTLEALMGFMGSPARWRTMPWMVTFFGIVVIPLGLTHILLVISQPVVVGHWCTLCLLAAAIMLPMIPLEVDEVVAMGQFPVQARREGKPFWRTFWQGDTVAGGGPDERSPELTEAPSRVVPAMFWGLSYPWTLIASAFIGAWLMFVPWALGNEGIVADIDHVGGALVIVTSVIAFAEVVRLGRFFNVVLGLAVAIVPWFVDGATTAGLINDTVCGAVIVLLAIPRGPVREHYGLWHRYVR